MNAYFYKLTILITRYMLWCLLVMLLASCLTESTPVYQLSVSSNPPEGGTVNPEEGEFDEGTEVEIRATPNGNWVFAEWQGDHSGIQNPDTITMNSDMSITALFEVASLDQDQFTGTYLFTQLSPSSSVAGFFSDGWIFENSQSFTANIISDPGNTPNGRIFTASPLSEFDGFPTEFPFTFQFADDPEDNSVTLREPVDTELTCGDQTILYGPASTDNAGSFDISDDSEFTLVVRENSNSQCGLGPEDITFNVAKVGSKGTGKRLNFTNQSEYNNGKKNQIRRELPNVN